LRRTISIRVGYYTLSSGGLKLIVGAGKSGYLAELFEVGFEVFDDFLGKNVGIGKIVRGFEALVSKPENVEAGLVAIDEFVVC
jgi:hypothetical protein